MRTALIRQPYKIIYQNSGPVRAIITIASEPFDYEYQDVKTKCQLYRVISLHKDANYILEELRLVELPAAKDEKRRISLDFGLRYFSYIDFGLDRYRLNPSPEWLIMGADNWLPVRGYGFATSARIQSFYNPAPEFPTETGKQHRTFSWMLNGKGEAKCLHLFSFDKAKVDLEAEVEKSWYEIISKPPSARLL